MLLTLFGISVLIFVLLRIVPGNIADILFDAAGMIDPAEKAKIEKDLGLDQPIAVQYVALDRRSAHGDLGYSYVSEKPALARNPAAHPDHRQARRAGAAVLGAVRRAARRDQRGQAEHRARLCAARGQPQRPVDAVVLARPADPDGLRALFRHHPDLHRRRRKRSGTRLLLYSIPAAAVGFRSSALIMRLTRSSMLEVLRQDYIRTARAKGASETSSTIITRCATRSCRSSP